MSTTAHPDDRSSTAVEVLTDEEADTVTFVADFDGDGTVPPTEWMTAAAEDVVDLAAHR
jgi:hypothetical protein